MTEQARKSERKRLPTQTEAAKLLHVSRGHLNRVLVGRRESIPLLARYYALLAGSKAGRSETDSNSPDEKTAKSVAPA